ncbi:MAG: erythromycin biosynthesis sensory transduction protein eryC1 [Chthoniobacterales bacterium]|nr:MAG: erythromycin biosynthesis sensory transduction protein eryC1 [Chthoniobacterales bacterium]
MKVPFLDLKAHHAPLRDEFELAINQVIDSGIFAGGPAVVSFEEAFAAYCNCEHAVGLGSGTEAVWLALLACGIGPGDEVITVPSTFMATAEAITYAGATPVFVDVDEQTYTMDPAALAGAVSKRTKAIVPVHLFGQMAEMDAILKFAKQHRLVVIEDAAQAHGAEYKSHPAGSMGQVGCFSFYPGKNLGALGEAGAVVTNNSQLRDTIRTLRDHGQARKYHHDLIGWNCRMDAMQGAFLAIKLRHLERGNELRRSHARRYREGFNANDEVIQPVETEYSRHVYHVYAIRVKQRDELMQHLERKGIGCGVHYPVPVHLQKAYAHLGYGRGAFPVSETIADEFVSLPMYPELSNDQIDYVIEAVTEAVGAGVMV